MIRCVYLKNKKGLTLIELILYIALLAIILPVISTMVVYGFDSYRSNYNMVQQEDTVNRAVQFLRKDIEAAAVIQVDPSEKILTLGYYVPPNTPPNPPTTREWKLDGSALYLGTSEMVNGIDSANSSFKLVNKGTDKVRIVLTIKPEETNKIKNKNRNYIKPIITEFSVKYKIVN